MNKKWLKFSGVALLSLYLAACDTNDEDAVTEDGISEVYEDEEEADSYLDEEVEESNEDIEEESENDLENDEDEADSHGANDDAEAEVTESLEIEGMSEHYHTGELVELTAVLSEETDYDDWHWYMRDDETSDWEMISGQNSSSYIGEAPENSVEMRVVLYDDSHQAYAQSEPIALEVDNH